MSLIANIGGKLWVVALDNMIELDKIKVITAERMLYKGMLPKNVKF